MLDVPRKPYSTRTLRCVRGCRFYKIRQLHLHLSDGDTHGSSLEPTRAWASQNFAWAGGGRAAGIQARQLRALVRFADGAAHAVPEIETPGHSGQLRATACR